MRFSRTRYVSWCQRTLVTAVVLSVGVSAAGVRTLDIVEQPQDAAGAQGADAASLAKAPVDTAPVTPKVREVPVTGVQEKGATGAPKRLVTLSEPQPVHGYATVGVTWKHGVDYAEDALSVQVRTEKSGVWSGWTTAEYHDEHGPNGGTDEKAARDVRPGTDAVVIGDVDRVQMRAETTDGTTPPDLELAIIDPGTGTMTQAAPAIDTSRLTTGSTTQSTAHSTTPLTSESGEAQDAVTLRAMRAAPKPTIYSRAQWGANEKLRDQSLPDYGTVKAGFIHHTVNANDYTADQVPALLRGIYAYHTQSRGWRDIGYNYLVDRFGRIWEGRYGGVDKAVVGAHTSGYNEVSFALSAIGNYDIAAPPQAVLTAYAKLFAWKLSLYNIRADTTHIWVKNRWLNAINGHRDAGQTACPGKYLYAKIPYIRALAQSYQNAAQGVSTITLRWRAIGGYHSVVGGPTGNEYSVAGGRARTFKKGRIYAKPGVGTFQLYGKVLKAYNRRGAVHSRLGFPRTTPIRFKRGTLAGFEKGVLRVYRSGKVKVTYFHR